jgi:anthranilate synthase component 2
MVDNYDSFTFNLVQYVRELAGGQEVRVVRNDVATVEEILALEPRALLLSPGPGVPESAGVCVELVRRAEDVPVLGVCLGHQALAVAYGAVVGRAPVPRHGKTSQVRHDARPLFAGIPDPFTATRYHSLVAVRRTLPAELEVCAWSEDSLVMGLAHAGRPHFGVQFHPESYLTQGGHRLIANFLRIAGLDTAGEAA